jgi:hypothetical protein
MNSSCFKYPKGFARAGRWDTSLLTALGIPKKFFSTSTDPCLDFSGMTTFSGFITDDRSDEIVAVLITNNNNSETVNRTSPDHYSYYELYPHNPVNWHVVHFGYTEHVTKSRIGAPCIAFTTPPEDPQSTCSALPTCLGYRGSCLIGRSAQNLTFEEHASSLGSSSHYYYYEKIYEHRSVSWIVENAELSAAIAIGYIILIDLISRKLITKYKGKFKFNNHDLYYK